MKIIDYNIKKYLTKSKIKQLNINKIIWNIHVPDKKINTDEIWIRVSAGHKKF